MQNVARNHPARQSPKIPAGLLREEALHDSLAAAREAQAAATDSDERLLLAAECVVLHRIAKGNSIAVGEWQKLAAQLKRAGEIPTEAAT